MKKIVLVRIDFDIIKDIGMDFEEVRAYANSLRNEMIESLDGAAVFVVFDGIDVEVIDYEM